MNIESSEVDKYGKNYSELLLRTLTLTTTFGRTQKINSLLFSARTLLNI